MSKKVGEKWEGVSKKGEGVGRKGILNILPNSVRSRTGSNSAISLVISPSIKI